MLCLYNAAYVQDLEQIQVRKEQLTQTIVSSITSHTAPQGTAEASNIKPASIDQGHYCLPVYGRHKTEQLQTSEVLRPEQFFRASQDLSEIEL